MCTLLSVHVGIVYSLCCSAGKGYARPWNPKYPYRSCYATGNYLNGISILCLLFGYRSQVCVCLFRCWSISKRTLRLHRSTSRTLRLCTRYKSLWVQGLCRWGRGWNPNLDLFNVLLLRVYLCLVTNMNMKSFCVSLVTKNQLIGYWQSLHISPLCWVICFCLYWW